MRSQRISTLLNKKKVIEALKTTGGNVTAACKAAGIGRTRFYDWLREDESFLEQVKNIEMGALKFSYCKTYLQACRGYKKAQRRLLSHSASRVEHLIKLSISKKPEQLQDQ